LRISRTDRSRRSRLVSVSISDLSASRDRFARASVIADKNAAKGAECVAEKILKTPPRGRGCAYATRAVSVPCVRHSRRMAGRCATVDVPHQERFAMTRKSSQSATNPDQAQQADHVAVNDRKASRGADYAHDNNRSAEGNDASLTSGPAFERRVHADGTVEAVPEETDDGNKDETKTSRDGQT